MLMSSPEVTKSGEKFNLCSVIYLIFHRATCWIMPRGVVGAGKTVGFPRVGVAFTSPVAHFLISEKPSTLLLPWKAEQTCGVVAAAMAATTAAYPGKAVIPTTLSSNNQA